MTQERVKTPIKITIHHNPFQFHQNVEILEATPGQSIREWLNTQGIKEFAKPTICLVNGAPVLRKDWDHTVIMAEAPVSFLSIPQGGGGDGKILRTVLMVAVMVAAPYAGAALAPMLGITSAIAISALTATIAIAGMVLINVLIPPPQPSAAPYNATQPSPTYSLSAQGNQARLGEPIPVIYGRHVIYPDFAATPYSEFINNDQYLYQLHVIGQGEYEVEQIRIEDTPITSFKEITYEIIPPGGTVTLVDSDVVTAAEIAGQELSRQELLATDDGGGQATSGWVGPFVANPSETQTTLLALDMIFPKGLYYAEDNGGLSNRTVTWEVQARLIDNEGIPIQGIPIQGIPIQGIPIQGSALGTWETLAKESHTANTNTPIRKTSQLLPAKAGRLDNACKADS